METKQLYFQIYLSFLIPDYESPCGIFIHYKGKFLQAVKKGEIIGLPFVAKMYEDGNYFCYIQETEKKQWVEWFRVNRFKYKVEFEKLFKPLNERSVDKAKYISYALKKIDVTGALEKREEVVPAAQNIFREMVHDPLIDWFFTASFEKENKEHTARVTYLFILFREFFPELVEHSQFNSLILSSIIHELRGSPFSLENKVASVATLDYLTKKKIVLPSVIVQLIRQHDELADGSGNPSKLKEDQIPEEVRVFSVLDHFDHYRSCIGGVTNKVKIKSALDQLEKKVECFDPGVMIYFKKFVEGIVFR
ncbi:MAG: hypothetical protein ISR65_10735 [Bacteriovoracaceae bacterium]|nr:hypothetical protein [Bacteriovoracaceae bacterium]